MSGQGFRQGRYGLSIISSLCLITVLGCGSSQEEPPAADSNALSSSATEVVRSEGRGEEAPAPPPSSDVPDVPHESPDPNLSASRGAVLASKELGMVVTGTGAGSPGRSLDILEGQVLSFLPQLQELYDREREQDPGLMGSLEVSLMIEPRGEVSDLRFPLTRVSSEKLITAVFDRMRAWTFPPADAQVQLRYTLLFVPPGVDHASILTWEKNLGSRTVMDRSGESRTSVAAAPKPAKKPSVAKAAAPQPARRPAPAESSRAKATDPARDSYIVGWYRVTRPATLYAAPRDASEVVARLRPGMRVRVVGMVAGEWLEVHSMSNRPPGFLRRGDARPESEDGAGRS
jgi:hypothetical protein